MADQETHPGSCYMKFDPALKACTTKCEIADKCASATEKLKGGTMRPISRPRLAPLPDSLSGAEPVPVTAPAQAVSPVVPASQMLPRITAETAVEFMASILQCGHSAIDFPNFVQYRFTKADSTHVMEAMVLKNGTSIRLKSRLGSEDIILPISQNDLEVLLGRHA